MKDIQSTGLQVQDNRFFVLDQQLLPLREEWIEVGDPDTMVTVIKSLKIRGAPMIGIGAAISLALYAEQGASRQEINQAGEALKKARPTAVNLEAAINRMLRACEETSREPGAVLGQVAVDLFEEDRALCRQIAEHGVKLLGENEKILTICNTGRIATAGIGTALGVIYRAQEKGLSPTVFVSETRPLLQGGRLTAWELQKYQVPCQLLCDSAAGALMAEGLVSKILVGADRIARNGDTANKIGTYPLAVLANFHQIPFFVVAPSTTLDPNCASGAQMVIEQRSDEEVKGAYGAFGAVQWSPTEIPVYNPAFDVTPHSLITGFILDTGSISALPSAGLSN